MGFNHDQRRRNTFAGVRYTIAGVLLLASLAMAGTAQAFDASSYAAASRLATGRWVKISVPDNGLYQITDADARSWGFTSAAALRVYGYGGHPLPEAMSADTPDDLPAVPVTRVGGAIVFYGAGPTTWTADNTRGAELTFVQVQHPYATAGYYFVTEDAAATEATPVSAAATPSGEPATTFVERLFHEQELLNPGETGRNLLGEDISSRPVTVSFDLPGRVAGTPVVVRTDIGSCSTTTTGSMTFAANGTTLPAAGDETVPLNTDSHHIHYYPTSHYRNLDLGTANKLDWRVTYASINGIKIARLDFVTVNYERNLALTAGQALAFGDIAASAGKAYRLQGGGSGVTVWDVTTPWQPQALAVAEDGTFAAVADGHREYVAFAADAVTSLPHPTMQAVVANQNIHAEQTPDLIILAPNEYLAQAQRLAQLHATRDTMRVLVLDHTLVFNEFSSGTPDVIAYRRLCKMFYDRGEQAGETADGHSLRYLLLMGGGSYDNRQVSAKVAQASYPMLLLWQSEASSNENTSFCSDDIIATLGDGVTSQFHRFKLDIAVGRMPARSLAELRVMVDKTIKYVSEPDYGPWKLNMLHLADDQDGAVHMQQAEMFIDRARNNGAADFIHNHVFIDAYPAVTQGSGRVYPAAREAFYNSLAEGQLYWHYTGHANPNSMTAEGILQRNDFTSMFYYHHLPVFYGATCEIVRFDASVISGAELLYTNANGGVAAIIAPPRLVYVTNNGALSVLYGRNFMKRDDNGRTLPLGETLRLAKNARLGDTNTSRYFFIGDPVMRMAVPNNTVVVDRIGDTDVSGGSVTDKPVYKARQTINISGHITDYGGNTLTDFDGEVTAILYDSEQSVVTNGNGSDGVEFTYLDRPNKLALVKTTVTHGAFNISLVVPSEIVATYDNYSPSMVHFYACDRTHALEAMGSNSDFYIYGYDDSDSDTTPPMIDYMGLNNTSSFVDGTAVNSSPLLLARVSDDHGINVSQAGIGHNLSLTLDDTVTYSDVASFYQADVSAAGEGGAGIIRYKLNDLAEGSHTLRLRVWDVYNNSAERTIQFYVKSGLRPELVDAYAVPNPARTEAKFYIEHNRPDAVAAVSVQVYDLMGRLVWDSSQSGRSDEFTSAPVVWDLTDNAGKRVPRGIYVYRASLSIDGSREVSKGRRIAVTGE